MNTILIWHENEYQETPHGNEDRDTAIAEMFSMIGAVQSQVIKSGMRAYVESYVLEGKIVVALISRGQVIRRYAIAQPSI